MANAFQAADILLPKVEDFGKWSVVACDQYSSNPEYWDKIKKKVSQTPSMLHLILPEAWLNTDLEEQHKNQISKTMDEYLKNDLFIKYPGSYIYVERTLNSGLIRRGLMGMVDLEQYEYDTGIKSPIRATEATIVERIPPRKEIRSQASLEFPHILLLADDDEDVLLSQIEAHKNEFEIVYDFDLMENGGHITGWLVNSKTARCFDQTLADYTASVADKYSDLPEKNLVFAVGDGNHSLATAKACWEDLKRTLSEEEIKNHPARYALAELENIHDESQQFEPIHRIVKGTLPAQLLEEIKPLCHPSAGFPVRYFTADEQGMLYLDFSRGELAVAILQSFLDDWLKTHPGEIDYIHGEEDLKQLASRPGSIGFILPVMEKKELFRGVISDGSLPRKTFSMGHANEKRYYLEGRRIR